MPALLVDACPKCEHDHDESPVVHGAEPRYSFCPVPPAGRVDIHLTDTGGARMPKYVIERELPGAGKLSRQELQAISEKSCSVLDKLGPQIQWVQSYVTDDKIYCVYIAPDEAMVREHARQGGFPANRVSEVRTMIDPTTAER